MEIEILRGHTRAFKRVNRANVAPFEEVVIRIVPSPPPENVPAGRYERDGKRIAEVMDMIVPAGTFDFAMASLGFPGLGELEDATADALEAEFQEARAAGDSIERAVRAALGPAAPSGLVRWVTKLARQLEAKDVSSGRWVLYDLDGHAVGWITDRRDIDDDVLAEYMLDEGHYEGMRRMHLHLWRHFDDGRIRYVMDADSRRPVYRWIFVEGE